MPKLPSKTEVLDHHKEVIELELCQRDYNIMATYWPKILDRIETALAAGVTPEHIKRWAKGITNETGVVNRCYNAARYAASLAENS
jgi:hypothetical protein